MNLRRLFAIGGGLYVVYLIIALVLVFFGLRWVYGLYRSVFDTVGVSP